MNDDAGVVSLFDNSRRSI